MRSDVLLSGYRAKKKGIMEITECMMNSWFSFSLDLEFRTPERSRVEAVLWSKRSSHLIKWKPFSTWRSDIDRQVKCAYVFRIRLTSMCFRAHCYQNTNNWVYPHGLLRICSTSPFFSPSQSRNAEIVVNNATFLFLMLDNQFQHLIRLGRGYGPIIGDGLRAVWLLWYTPFSRLEFWSNEWGLRSQ